MGSLPDYKTSLAVTRIADLYPDKTKTPEQLIRLQSQLYSFFSMGTLIRDRQVRDIANQINEEVEKDEEAMRTYENKANLNEVVSSALTASQDLPTYQEAVLKGLVGDNTEDQGAFYEFFKRQGLLDEESVNSLKQLTSETKGQGWILNIGIIISLFKGYLDAIMNTVGGDFAKKMSSVFTPATLDPNLAVRGMFIAPEKYDDYFKSLKENGLSDSDIDKMIISNYNLSDVTTIQMCYWRKIITKEKAQERLAEHGFTPERINEIMSTWEVIPSISDILYMLAKEAFEPDQIRELGLNAEFPTEAVEWAEKQGLSREWLQKYWYAHWQLPSIQMGYEMLHRDVLDDQGLDSLFRAQEIPPFWRDKLKAISYSPFTRVDIRRMYADGVVTKEQVYRNYLDLGYDEEKAALITEWTVKDVLPNQKDLTRSQIEKGYRDDILTFNEAKKHLTDIGYTDDASTYILNYVDYQESKSLSDAIVDGVKKGYVSGKFTREYVVITLRDSDITNNKINYLLKVWDQDRLANEKLVSKEDIYKFYKAKIISIDQVRQLLKQLNYSDSSIELYVKLYEGATDE